MVFKLIREIILGLNNHTTNINNSLQPIIEMKLFLQAVKSNQLRHNHEITREAYALCHRLPVIDCKRLSNDLYDQYNDVTLMTYLGVISKGCHTMNQFVAKFNALFDRQGVGRRIRGLFL